jgi:hypothetical protein
VRTHTLMLKGGSARGKEMGGALGRGGGGGGAYENADGIKKQGDLTVVGLPDLRLCVVYG